MPRFRLLILLATAIIVAAQPQKPELVLQTGPVESTGTIAFSPDGATLAAFSQTGSRVRIYSVSTGAELAVLETGAADEIAAFGRRGALRFSRDGRTLWTVVGSAFRQFDTRTGAIQQSKNFNLNGVRVDQWQISGDGHFASGTSHDRDEVAPLLNLRAGFERSLGENVLAITPDSRFALTDGMEAISKQQPAPFLYILRDLSTGRIASGFKPLASPTNLRGARQLGQQLRGILRSSPSIGIHFQFTPDGATLAQVSSDFEDSQSLNLTLFEVSSGRERSFSLPASRTGFALSNDLQLAAAARSSQVSILDLTTGRAIATFPAGAAEISAVAFSTDRRFLATAAVDKTITIWDLAQAAAGTVTRLRGLGEVVLPVHAVEFTADSRNLIVGTSQSVHTWEFGAGTGTRSLRVPYVAPRTQGSATGFQTYTLLGAGGTLAASQSTSRVTVWDRRTGREIAAYTPQSESGFGGIVISPDGETLAYGEMSGMTQASMSAEAYDRQQEEYSAAMRTHGAAFRKFTVEISTALAKNDKKKADEIERRARQELPPVLANTLSTLRKSIEQSHQMVRQGSSPPSIQQQTQALQARFSSKLIRIATGEILWTGPGTVVGVSTGARWLARSDFSTCQLTLIERASNAQSETAIPDCLGISRVVFSPKGLWLAAAYIAPGPNGSGAAGRGMLQASGALKVWELSPQGLGREVLTRRFDTFANIPAFTPDDTHLAISGAGPPVELIDLTTGQTRRSFISRNHGVTSLSFSPDGTLLAIGSQAGEAELWHALTGEHLASLVTLNGGSDWLVVTPDGLFDGTPASWKQILWRFSENVRDVAPVESYFNEYYYPGLLSDLIRGRRPKPPAAIGQKDRRQPKVSLASNGEGRTMTIKVSIAEPEAGVGARDLRLFRNGTLVKAWRGDILAAGQREVTLEARVPVIAGENRFTAYAFNRDNVKSLDAELSVTGAPALARKGVAYVLAFGVNQYANAQYNLRYAVADAQTFAAELRAQQQKLNTYERVELITLADNQATKSRILETLKTLAAQAQPEDLVVIFFAGHGFARGPRFYQIPHDLGYTGPRDQLNEAGLETIAAHSISDLELESAVESLDSGQLILIIDACNSGQALESEEKRRGPMNSQGLAQLAYEKGIYILTAAQSYQAALEAAQLGHGFLTYSLIEEGLKKGAADYDSRDGQILAREWFNFAAERVPQMQEQLMQTRDIVILQQDQPGRKSTQKPRVFYRRESEQSPLVIAKP